MALVLCHSPETVNDKVDRCAKLVTDASIAHEVHIESMFLFEQVKTVTVKKAANDHLGLPTTPAFCNKDKIISSENFDLVWWDRVGGAMQEFAKMCQVWVTPHSSKLCGTNKQMLCWKPRTSPICP